MGRNTVGKGEIARYEQFLLFPQCFQKACFLGASKVVTVWELAKQRQFPSFELHLDCFLEVFLVLTSLGCCHFLTLNHTIPTFNDLLKTLWEKKKNAGNQHFLLFPQCFLPFPTQFQIFSQI